MFNFIESIRVFLYIIALLLSACRSHNNTQNDIQASILKSKKDNLTASLPAFNLSVHLNRIIPANYAILDSVGGDLNGDDLRDLIIVLNKKGEDSLSNTTSETIKRPLLILFRNKLNTELSLQQQNSNVVYCYNCGGVMGDPFTGISINGQSFSVSHYGGSSWRWSRELSFQYNANENKWLLFSDESESFHVTDPNQIEKQVKTEKEFGKIKFEEFDIYKD